MNEKDKLILRAVLAGYDENQGWSYWDEGDKLNVSGFGDIEVVFAHRPFDENGRSAELIFGLDDPDGKVDKLFFKKTGEYESWDGLRWDGPFRQVFPKTRVVYDYE